MSNKGYGNFCPTAKAAEILEPRWTMLILGEMAGGSTRFNDIRRGVPGISPTLLSKRLKELEGFGLVERIEDRATGAVDYIQTAIAEELNPIIWKLGEWAWKHVEAEVSLQHLDAKVLLWNIRRKIALGSVVSKRTVVRYHFTDAPEGERFFWLIWKPGVEVDVCIDDPGFEVDLFIEAELKAFTAFWMNWSPLSREVDAGRIALLGNPLLIRTIDKWMVRSSFGAPEATRPDDAQRAPMPREATSAA